AQPCLELAAERADVRNPEHARELEQLDRPRVRHVTCPPEAWVAKALRSWVHPISESKRPRISSRRSPSASSPRCSSSTRVPCPPAMKRTSTSVRRSGSCLKSASISHERIKRVGGSQTSTRPQSQVLPSSPCSYHRPPTRGSITASTALALPIL